MTSDAPNAGAPPPSAPPSPAWLQHPDLASERLGGRVLWANDDFFAEKENLLKPEAPVWREHEYTDRGKWMDGWESRRRRTPGHDWCIVRLGLPGVSARRRRRHRVLPRQLSRALLASRPARSTATRASRSSAAAVPSGSRSCRSRRCSGDSQNLLRGRQSPHRFTHLRLNIFPDGGVARLRVHGEVVPDWPRDPRRGERRRSRPRRGRARRPLARGQRHVLRRAAQPAHARPRRAHGRRLGDEAPPRSRPRLGGAPPRHRGHGPTRRGRHRALQGQLPRHVLARGRRRAPQAPTTADCDARAGTGAKCCRSTKLEADQRAPLRRRTEAPARATHVRLNDLPRRRRRAALRLLGEPSRRGRAAPRACGA